MNTRYLQQIAQELSLPKGSVEHTVELLDQDATVPFIARYRKEATGGLDEVEIRAVSEAAEKYRGLEKRRTTILKTIEEQGQLDEALRARIEACMDPKELEDLYLPYKPKRKTRGSRARELGLASLALRLLEAKTNGELRAEAESFVGEEVPSAEAAIAGARDIIAELAAESAEARLRLRSLYAKEAIISSSVVKKKKEAGAKYRDYFEWSERFTGCPAHRYLALRRGESEGILRVSVGPGDTKRALQILKESFAAELPDFIARLSDGAQKREAIPAPAGSTEQVAAALEDSFERLIAPSLENEFRAEKKKQADEESIGVFATNLRQLLLAPPLGRKRVLAADPGYRTGCKIVCLDERGMLLANTTIYPHEPQRRWDEALATVSELLVEHRIDAIAVGNGTAGRETERLMREAAAAGKEGKGDRRIPVFLVSEDGASVYSASDIGRREFPDYDVTVRGAVSIGRRLMDPLSELVKIDPKALGIGQYQHDVDQKALKKSLDAVVESCVNSVGVDLETAGEYLLRYVSGLGPKLAQAIVAFRSEQGSFSSREELRRVPGLGPKAFQQCAGFLRISGAENPLDGSAVHPESYHIVEQMAADLSVTSKELMEDASLRASIEPADYVTESTGLPTLQDIMEELARPGRDPRSAVEEFSFREDISSIDDLSEEMILPGRVSNLTRFGAFVDIGIKTNGLVHISELAERYVRDPAEVVSLGEEIRVRVIDIDKNRKRIALSLKGVEE